MHRTVHHFTLLGILVLFQLCQSNEYYPKRFLINNSEIHDESINNENILDTKYSNPIDQCPIQCFIDNDSGDMVNCSISQEISVKSSKKSFIRCERNIETGELILGHKESVRGITPGALGHLLEATSISNQPLSRSGQLEFHINLNMVRLDAKCFQDLGGLITDIRLLNTVYMHPDSLIDLQHLRSFEIESGQTPLYLSDDDDHGVNDNSKNDTYMMEVDDLVKRDSIKKPAFIRLHPLDNTVPISFNLNTKCHQCDLQSDGSDVDGNSSSSRSGSSSSSGSKVLEVYKRQIT
ncbi:unnamed protein product [Heterobilharzia americana]|nr:unnamed protein product [Heterobilharzia americana]